MNETPEIARIRAALEAGPTPGPWVQRPHVSTGLPFSPVVATTLVAKVYSTAFGDVAQESANAALIAACNPPAITAVLAHIDAQAAEIERLRADNTQKRGLLLWALWHHQGGNSPVGQPIRWHFGIGPFDRMTAEQIRDGSSAAAKEQQ